MCQEINVLHHTETGIQGMNFDTNQDSDCEDRMMSCYTLDTSNKNQLLCLLMWTVHSTSLISV
jgi:hypothetical protein